MSFHKNLAALILIPATIASFTILNAQAHEDKSTKIELTEKQQVKLDEALKGRVAGPAKSCIQLRDQKKLKIISDDVFIFQASRNSKTIYINKPNGGCPRAQHNTLIYEKPDTPLCHGEIVTVVDLYTNSNISSCAFGKFVPYTRE